MNVNWFFIGLLRKRTPFYWEEENGCINPALVSITALYWDFRMHVDIVTLESENEGFREQIRCGFTQWR